jgi:voltage-gated potassium channel
MQPTAGGKQDRAVRRINERLVALTVVSVLVLVICPLAFYAAERRTNPAIEGVSSSYTWLLRTLLEGGSAYSITTGAGHGVYYLVEIAGVSLVAFASGAIASRLVTIVITKGKGMGATRANGHIVICGWSGKGAEIIRELRAEQVDERRRVVVLAQLENDPTKVDDVEFIRGDPAEADDLRRAGIDRCDTAIVLADEAIGAASDSDRDARTLFTVLAIESINPDCYTCVEVIRSENREHFDRTRANELVVSAELTGALLAGSARSPGLSRLVADLVTHPESQEFYRLPVPNELAGSTVHGALLPVKEQYDALLVGLVNHGDHYELNPKGDRVLTADDVMLVIADHVNGNGATR